MKEFSIGVFTEWRNGRKPKISAYSTWYNPDWKGCCVHKVSADTGTEAKKMAIEDHKRKCMIGIEQGQSTEHGFYVLYCPDATKIEGMGVQDIHVIRADDMKDAQRIIDEELKDRDILMVVEGFLRLKYPSRSLSNGIR